MRDAVLIRERMEPLLQAENITESELVDDWRECLKEMAKCGIDVSSVMLQLELYHAQRRRFCKETSK